MSFHKSESWVNSVSARLHTGRLKVNLEKNRKRMVTKVEWLYWKCTTVGSRISGHSAAGIFTDFTEEHKSWDQFDECVSQKLRSVMRTSEKTKVRRSEKFKSKFLISAFPTLWNLRIDLRRRLKDRSDVPAETRGDWPKYLEAQRKGQSYLLLTNHRMVSPSATRNKTGGKRICCRFRSINAHVWAGKTWTLPNWKP